MRIVFSGRSEDHSGCSARRFRASASMTMGMFSSLRVRSALCKASAVFSCILLLTDSSKHDWSLSNSIISIKKGTELLTLSAPLSLNRVCVSLLSTLETVQLPQMLILSGLTSSQALSIYGVFSGMAFPLIMFPCALTGSAGSLLLPYISEQEAKGNKKRIRQATALTICCCFLLGVIFMLFLLIFADIIGLCLFHNDNAAKPQHPE